MVLPPAPTRPSIRTVWSAVPWIASSETGCGSAQDVTIVPATGATAWNRSVSHASRYAIIAPFDIPVANVRSVLTPNSVCTCPTSAVMKPTSSTSSRGVDTRPQQSPAFQSRSTPSG